MSKGVSDTSIAMDGGARQRGQYGGDGSLRLGHIRFGLCGWVGAIHDVGSTFVKQLYSRKFALKRNVVVLWRPVQAISMQFPNPDQDDVGGDMRLPRR